MDPTGFSTHVEMLLASWTFCFLSQVRGPALVGYDLVRESNGDDTKDAHLRFHV
jgi:hypothetical protein